MLSLKPLLSHHPQSPFLPCRVEADCCPLRPAQSKLSWAAAPLLGGFFPGGDNLLRPLARIRRGVTPWSQNCRWDGLVESVGEGEKGNGGHLKNTDVVTLGNLCVDIVLNVPSLPPPSREGRREYFDRLSASPPDKKFWEAGGNCNFSIAAARLGLQCSVLGYIGDEIYGRFLLDVLQEEGIGMVGMNEDSEAAREYSASYQTLLCWVLVDPFQRHGFCSRADFSIEPAFSWMKELSRPVLTAIRQSKILFCNGYVFDELYTKLIVSALDSAISAETTVFFDPGPRGRSLSTGTPEEKRALELFLEFSDVLLLTSDEAEALTGLPSPILAGQKLISQGTRTNWVIIKIGSKGSVLVTKSCVFCAPAFEVNVFDTVGCGDSFTAAIAFGYLQNMPEIEMLALANAVGAATATGCGAGRNVANRDKVLELLRLSNLNDDYQFWNHLLETVMDKEVVLLSKSSVNGSNANMSCVPIRSVASRLVLELEKKECAFSKDLAE
ncbi:unnamed protein product [Spirodela intermedia]|uniref:Carbohydrate kinase PfkB domain-containing protein n=1 Tax=Spirodela intermedia TaxID=51605 RepID=A0A7I8KBR2_SPIIN|nr:unnamed protein product [Spirodela intermedia]